MKKMIFSNIHSLEDIHKLKLRLEKKLSVTEKSISDKTDVAKLLFSTNKGVSSFIGEKDSKLVIIGYLLPLGIKFLLKLIQNDPDRKLFKRLLIYSALGSVTALLVYQYLGNRKTKAE